MERQGIIEQTIKNMKLIYSDVSEIGQLIEEKMKNSGFEPLGDSAYTWEISTALGKPDQWLYKYFARAYLDAESPQKTVGFCVHLGGYERNEVKKFAKLSITLPVANISLLKMEQEVKKLWRQDVYNCLWCAGWYDSYVAMQKISNNRIVYGKADDKEVKSKTVTYFVDFLSLTNGDMIKQFIAEPMVQMFHGDEEWVVKKGLNVVQIGENP